MVKEFREFEWPRIHITDEHFEEQIYNKAEEYVFDFYDIISIVDLTENQIKSIKLFKDTLPKKSFISIGLRNIIAAAENVEERLE